MRHVRLTMTDGTQVRGLHSQEAHDLVFRISGETSDNPNGKKAKEYDVENLTEME